MLDGMITSGRYKLVSLTANGMPVDYDRYVTSVTIPIIIKLAPHVVSSAYKLSCISYDSAPVDYSSYLSSSRHVLIVMGPPFAVYSVRDVFIIEQTEQGTPTQLPQMFEQALRENPVPPASLIYSTMRDSAVVQHAAIENPDIAFPISTMTMPQQAQKVLADYYVFMPISPMTVGASAELCLQSLVIQHTPVSMNYEHAVAEQVLVQRNVDPMWVSTGRLYNAAEKVVMGTEMPSHYQSTTTGLSVAQKVLQTRIDRFPRSFINTPIVGELALVANKDPFPRSNNEASEVLSMALVANVEPVPFSSMDSLSVAELSLSSMDQLDPSEVFGPVIAPSTTERVLIGSEYPSPTGMQGANVPVQVNQSLIQNIEAYPTSPSMVSQQGLEWLLGSTYQDPNTMLPIEGAGFDYSVAHTTVIARQEGNPISTTTSLQSAFITVMSEELESPEKMLTSGITATLIGEQFALSAEYPSSHVSQTTVDVCLTAESFAVKDSSFPDKGYSVSEVSASMVAETVGHRDYSFKSKDLVLSSLIVSGAYEVVSIGDESFPSKETSFSYLEAGMVVGTVASQVNDYPSKGVVQSTLTVGLSVETAATKAAYPPKDTPTSSLVVDLAAQVVARKDKSMYVMPGLVIPHRPNISVTIIY